MADPQYEVAPGWKFYDNMRMHEAGAKVTYLGEPGENLIPLNAEAKKAKERSGKVTPAKPLDAAERTELEQLRAFKAEHEAKT